MKKINVDKYEEEYQSSRNKIEQGYENATFLSLIQIPVAYNRIITTKLDTLDFDIILMSMRNRYQDTLVHQAS